MEPDDFSRRTMLALSTIGLAGCSTPDEPTDSATPGSAGYDPSLEHDETAWDGYDPEWSAPTDAAEPDLAVEVLAERLEIPWDLSVADNGDLFLTQRTGQVLRYADGEVTPLFEPANVIDAGSVEPGSDEASWFVDGGEGGTMGVEAHPNYPDVPLLYVCYTADVGEDERELAVRVAAFDPESDRPAAPATVLLEAPAREGTRANIHNGGRLRFGPANYLWVTTGDAGDGELAADPSSLAGKIHRLTPAGEGAPGNESGGDPRVFTLGHRNPQGISWLPDATPIENEHGTGPDELNALEAGTDYGWPEAAGEGDYAESDSRPPVASSQVEGVT